MASFEQALDIVMRSAVEREAERVPLVECFNRVLARDVVSDTDIPPFNKASMDGYACRRADLGGPLTVVDVIPAGKLPAVSRIRPGECAKIMTGAIVPDGADCVIMVEYTAVDAGGGIRFTGCDTDDNICPAGQDVKRGDTVLRKGELIRAPHIATLATVGCAEPLVFKRPTVGVIATGSELVEPCARITGAQIRDSNSIQIAVQAANAGALARSYGIVGDDRQLIRARIRQALDENDLVIVSGGVSAGDLDFVPEILEQCGVTLLFTSVAMKPGKPATFGTTASGGYCCGMPGNPVSSFIVFELLLKPLIYMLMGHVYTPPAVRAVLGTAFRRSRTERREAVPVKFIDPATVVPVEFHGSAHINSLCGADGLVFVPVGTGELKQGAPVDVRPLWT